MTNRIIHSDFLQWQPDPESVDLIIADPPYNLSKGGKWQWDASIKGCGFGGKWNKAMEAWDNMPLTDYINFTLGWLTLAKKALKKTGSMWIFGTYHNIGIINVACQLLGIEIINEIIWYKRNAFPNLAGRRLTASHETILWAHGGGNANRQYYFAYDYSKTGDFNYDSMKAVGKQMRTVWDIPNNKERWELAFGKHPTQKPVRILDRLIRLSSKPNDTVLSPFSGSGSECVAAKMANRNFIGIEIEKEYCDLARKRLANINIQGNLAEICA